MIRKAGKQGADGGGPDGGLEEEIDALFTLPLAEFTGARNTLAARLKKESRANDADRVKLLSKPSVSAWAVNQLYWNHRDAFDDLIFASKTFRPASTRMAGRVAGMRDSLDARREALTNLSELAAEILTGAGHNPSPDTMRRVLTTLEALSGYALLPDGPTPGRLTNDVDPPSFESLALLMSGAGVVRETEPAPSRKPDKSREKTNSAEVRRIEEFRQKKITAAKASLQQAKTTLSAARAKLQSSETAQKKASAQLKEAEKQKRQVESLMQKAAAAYDDAAARAESAEAEAREAALEIENAKRGVDEATKELESLLRK